MMSNHTILIGALLLLVGNPHFFLVLPSTMRRVVLNPLQDSVFIIIQSMWNMLPFLIWVQSRRPPLDVLVPATILQSGHST